MDIKAYIILCVTLFTIGVVGVLTRRNAIIIFAKASPTFAADAQILVFFIMVVAAAEVSVGLAIIVMLYRNIHNIDVNFLNRLKH